MAFFFLIVTMGAGGFPTGPTLLQGLKGGSFLWLLSYSPVHLYVLQEGLGNLQTDLTENSKENPVASWPRCTLDTRRERPEMSGQSRACGLE